MKQTSIPVYTITSEQPSRKVSQQNLSDLISALELMLNTKVADEMSNDLIGIMTSINGQLTSQLMASPSETIKHYKLLSIYFLDLIRGGRLDQGAFTARQWDITHNCPTLLIEFMTWFNGHRPKTQSYTNDNFWFCLQVFYAFLNGHRVIVTPINVDLNSITAPLSVKELPNLKEKWLPALANLGITPSEFQKIYKSMCSKARFTIVTSSGPNGQATWSADLDAKAILADPKLFPNMHKFAQESNLTKITSNLVSCVPTPLAMNPGHRENVFTGRIHAIEEWGGKTRLVAILDYWTQMLLTPLHDTINYFVKRLEQDGTFNQEKIANKVKLWTKEPKVAVNSYDLTAATDRIPIDIQVEMLSILFGSNSLPNLWKAILTDRTFYGPKGENIKYAVGQPMGAKSSFPMLALIHHVLVQIAALEAGQKEYSKYVVLGDDNTHGDLNVSLSYLKLMNSLGVEINLSKSVVSKTGLLSAGEICKRVFINGLELSAIPVKALVKTVRHGHLASTLQTLFHTRGDPLSKTELPIFFAGLLDKRSLQAILVLNRMPSAVTGLEDPIDLTAMEALKYEKWFTNLALTEEEILRAYQFALVSEQLKRVDGLLRSTMLMSETIKTMARPDPKKLWPVQLFESMSEAERATAISKLPELSWSHPIVHASQAEVERVTSHLSALRAGSKAMQDKARAGLLDLLRNNLSEIWMGEAEKTSTVRRSIFNAMLAALKRMDLMKPRDDKKRYIEFSIELVYVQRSWSVYWEFGSNPRINAVKTKVSVSKESNKNKLTEVFKDAKMSDFRV